ncbi:hypothetical protein CJ179_31700 [Rhodococcus sp. ACS1]|uniref:hypothetical protein n=1 Tax=Rhodococcus sp. ACS1 TaxID=2028570 RepID=UPI000BB137CC|nr:hypothetical protein [Rhodococcus sp. ACS1]PBC39751.1 hypothetical protein CJ179_31700 [Rhodococcus sp. ACS1]
MDPIIVILSGVVGAVAAYVVPLWLIRSGRSPRLAAKREVSTAIDNGALPPNADIWSWRTRVVENRQSVARGSWAMLAAGVLMSFVALANFADEGDSFLTWVFVWLAATLLAAAFGMHRQVKRADALLAAVTAGPTGTTNSGPR